mgnify:CR=1 FL=1
MHIAHRHVVEAIDKMHCILNNVLIYGSINDDLIGEAVGLIVSSFDFEEKVDPDKFYPIFQNLSKSRRWRTRLCSLIGLAYCSKVYAFKILADSVATSDERQRDHLIKHLRSANSKMLRPFRNKIIVMCENLNEE